MSTVVWLGERIRRYLRGRHTVVSQATGEVIPVFNVERLIDDYAIKTNTIAVNGNGTINLTTLLNELDYFLDYGYLVKSTGTYTLSDIQLVNTVTGDTIYISGSQIGEGINLRLYVPAGYQLRAVVSGYSAPGNTIFYGIFSFFDAKVSRNA